MQKIVIIIFLIFAFFHFYRLSGQEFVGDEASPILLVDKAWDVFKTKDIKLLAFPFLWYHDPFRQVFSGSLIHFIGVDKVILRLPGVIFSLGIFWLFYWIFKQEKIPPLLIIFSLFAYSSAAILLDYRLASGDSQAAFFILLAGYLIYKQSFIQAAWWWLAGALTMLDALVLVPALLLLKPKSLLKPGLIFLVYLGLWLVLPYLAYRLGYEPWYSNRGLWYYLSRVGEGAAVDLFLSFKALLHYSSYPLLILLIFSFIGCWFNRRLRFFQLIILPAWLAVLLLNRSSSHIVMFVGIFFLQAVLFLNWLWRKNKLAPGLIIAGLIIVSGFNSYHFYRHFLVESLSVSDPFMFGHLDVPYPGNSLDEAVKVLYQRHPTR